MTWQQGGLDDECYEAAARCRVSRSYRYKCHRSHEPAPLRTRFIILDADAIAQCSCFLRLTLYVQFGCYTVIHLLQVIFGESSEIIY